MKRTVWCVLALASVPAAMAGAQGNNNAGDRARTTVTRLSATKTNAGAAMVAAAARGDGAAARALLAQGADVSAATGDGMTALHWAAHYGDAALATALLKAGARTDAKSRVGGYTPLHVASRSGAGSVVKALLAAGANVNTPTETGAYAMHLAASSGSAEAVTALAAAKGDPNARETQWGQTPLMFAATSNRPATITALLKAGAKPSLHTQPLDLSEELARQQAAARKRNEVLLAALPKEQRDSIVEAMDKAATAQARQRAEFLGTAVPATPATAATPAGGAPAAAAPRRVSTAAPPISSLTATQVQDAILAGREVFDQPEPVKAPAEQGELLEGNIAGYEGTVGKLGGLTALLHAARQGNLAAAKALLDGGANINEVSATDSTSPLLMATINGQFDLAMELINRGADVKLASTAGLTPLYAAINTFWAPRSRYPQPQSVQTQKTSHLDLMRVMLKNGADVNVRLKKNLWFFAYSNCGNANCGLEQLEGTTPFWRATYAVDLEAMKMLKAAGADDTMPSFRTVQAGGRGGRGGGGGGGAAGGMVGVDAATDSAAKAAVPGIGVYPIHAAAGVGYGNGFAGNSHRHAPDGWMPTLKYLVEELGHDVNKRDLTGYTPLHHAAARGDNEMILYLVSKGADVKAVARNGRTTVDLANGPVQRLRPFPETIALLEKLGAKNSHRCVSC